jgi:surface protein
VPSGWTVEVPNYIMVEFMGLTISSGMLEPEYNYEICNIIDAVKEIIVDGVSVGLNNSVEVGSGTHTAIIHIKKDATSLSKLFIYNGSVTEIDFSNLDISNVTDMSYLLYYNQHMQNYVSSIDFSGLDFSNVENIEHMLSNTKLSSVTVYSDKTTMSNYYSWLNSPYTGVLYTNSADNIFAQNIPTRWSISLI